VSYQDNEGHVHISVVHGGFWLKPDRLTGRGHSPPKPSQTFSHYPARTALAEGSFCRLGAVDSSGWAFCLVKTPIEHKRD